MNDLIDSDEHIRGAAASRAITLYGVLRHLSRSSTIDDRPSVRFAGTRAFIHSFIFV